MVTVGLITDCSEPAATKYAIGHGVSSLRAGDRYGLRIQLTGCNAEEGLDVPGPPSVRPMTSSPSKQQASPTQVESKPQCDVLPHDEVAQTTRSA